jgi:CheY-like chemotaxis protein
MRWCQESNAAKDHFLAVLSHELRTPLTPALLAMYELEHDSDLPEPARQQAALAARNLQLEAQLIDDLLDVTRIAKGKLELKNRVGVELHELLQRTVEIVRSDADAKRIAFRLQFDSKAHYMTGDDARLQQMFWNILRNAIKFSKADSDAVILVRTRTGNGEADEAATRLALVDVVDTGIGIAPEVLPNLFKAFMQGSAGITREFGGLGLGLSIAQKIAQLHGGWIRVSSEGLNRGTTVTVALPAVLSVPAGPFPETVPVQTPLPHAPATKRSLRILLVEDNKATLMILQRLLQRHGQHGHTVVCAGSIKEALDAAQNHTFDVLVSDLGLPDGHGTELMRTLRRLQPAVLGIAVSGYGTEEDLQRSREAGFEMHLTKPIRPDALFRAIDYTCTMLDTQATTPPTSARSPGVVYDKK